MRRGPMTIKRNTHWHIILPNTSLVRHSIDSDVFVDSAIQRLSPLSLSKNIQHPYPHQQNLHCAIKTSSMTFPGCSIPMMTTHSTHISDRLLFSFPPRALSFSHSLYTCTHTDIILVYFVWSLGDSQMWFFSKLGSIVGIRAWRYAM